MTEAETHDLWKETVDVLWEALDQAVSANEHNAIGDFVPRWLELGSVWRERPQSFDPALVGELGVDSPESSRLMARYFTERLRLQNLAEDLARIQTVADRRGDASNPPRGSFEVLDRRLHRESALRPDQMSPATVVLTSHPTESTRRTVLQHMRKLASVLSQRPQGVIAETLWRQSVRRMVDVVWRTPSLRPNRPTVLDEVELGLMYVTTTLFQILPDVLKHLNHVLADHQLPPARWTIGSWIGGDRDGHPFVDAEVTAYTFRRQREEAFRLYRQSLDDLERTLSSAERYLAHPKLVEHWLSSTDEEPLGEARRDLAKRYPLEPLRQLVGLMKVKLDLSQRRLVGGYPHANAFRQEVDALGRLWADDPALWPDELHRLLGQIDLFGWHLLALDLRQHRRIHEEAIVQMIGEEFRGLEERQRLAVLEDLIQHPRALIPATAEVRDLKETLLLAASQQRQWGSESCPHYLISMAHGASDLLSVLAIMKSVDPQLSFDLIPVLEMLDDLTRAPEIFSDLLASPSYRRHLESRNRYQEIMLGFSDSTKDAGTMTASWAIFQAQRNLARWGQTQGIQIGFFHGRGGALGRGGGPSSYAILGQPAESAQAPLRMTHQGEVLSQKFLLPDMAWRSLELMSEAQASVQLFPPVDPGPRAIDLMNRLADMAHRTYRSLIDDPKFWDYFLSVTPISEMSALNWGSRPSWREQFRWEDLRAIPWVFSWSQNRLLLPGWYGAGTALSQVTQSEEDLALLRDLYQTWPFITTLLHNLELALVKSNLRVGEAYQRLSNPDLVRRFWPLIEGEYHRLYDSVMLISGHQTLLSNQPRLHRAVEWRNPHVDVLNYLQIHLLSQYRSSGDPLWLEPIAQTMEGIALGLRNTG